MLHPTEIATLPSGVVEYRHERRGRHTVLICHGGHLRAAVSLGESRFAANDFSVLVPSRPGYGRTPLVGDGDNDAFADAVAQLCTKLSIRSVVVLGMSAGTALALALTVRHPKLVKGLVLASAVSSLPWPDPVTKLNSSLAFHPWTQSLTWTGLHTAMSLVPGLGLRTMLAAMSTLTPDKVIADLRPAERTELAALFRSMSSGQGFAVDMAQRHSLEREQQVRRPTLVVASPTDGAVPFRHAQHLATHIPGATLWRSPSLSHMLWFGTGAAATEQEIFTFAQTSVRPRQSASMAADGQG